MRADDNIDGGDKMSMGSELSRELVAKNRLQSDSVVRSANRSRVLDCNCRLGNVR